jgi:hypothetical protein
MKSMVSKTRLGAGWGLLVLLGAALAVQAAETSERSPAAKPSPQSPAPVTPTPAPSPRPAAVSTPTPTDIVGPFRDPRVNPHFDPRVDPHRDPRVIPGLTVPAPTPAPTTSPGSGE